ncbi:MAG: hypothetical protein ACJ76J_13285 [Thermoanaerobaculia bacterium]
MKSIRIPAALFLLTFSLCTGIAMAQPSQIFGDKAPNESVSFVQVQEPALAKVWLALDGGPKYAVTSDVGDVATLPWRADAVCQTRLKSFSVKHPSGENGTKTTSQSLAATTKTLHGTGNLQSFPLELIRNRCLDIANVPPDEPLKTAVDAPYEREKNLRDQQTAFNANGWVETFIDGAQHPNAILLLTSQCSNAAGSQVTFQVVDKKIVPTISFLCCISGGDQPACR